jgi:hypothetical protein
VQCQRTRLPSTRSHLYRAEPIAAGNSDQPLRSTTRGLAQVINLQVRYSDSGASRPVASCGRSAAGTLEIPVGNAPGIG